MGFRDAELYSNVKCAGGVVLQRIPARVVAAWEDTLTVTMTDRLVLAVPRTHAIAPMLLKDRVIRYLGEATPDDDIEWRIVDRQDTSARGRQVLQVTCAAIGADLGRTVGYTVDAAGVPVFEYVLSPGSTMDDLIDGPVRGALDAIGLTWMKKGTIGLLNKIIPTGEFEQSGEYESPRQIIDGGIAKVGGELRVRRNGDTDYRIDVLDEIGSDLPVLHVRTAKNLLSNQRTFEGAQSFNRITPRAQVDGADRQIGYAYFKATAIDGVTKRVTFEDPRGPGYPKIIRYDDQLNGKYAAIRGVTFVSVEIVDTLVATQELEFASVAAFTVGDLIEFRTASGATAPRLTYLDNPAAQARDGAGHPGVFGKVLDAPNRSGAVNYAANGDGSIVSNPLNPPDGWTLRGTPAISYDTTNTQYGGSSLSAVFTSSAHGVRSTVIKVYDASAYLWRMFAWVWGVDIAASYTVGVVNASTFAAVTGGTPVASPDQTGGSFICYAFEIPGTSMPAAGVVIEVRGNGACTVSVDAFGVMPLGWERLDIYTPEACDLWHEGQDALVASEMPARYDLEAADLAAVDPVRFAAQQAGVGQTMVLRDLGIGTPGVGITVTQRITAITRNRITKGMKIETGDARLSFIDLLNRRRPETVVKVDVKAIGQAIGQAMTVAATQSINAGDAGGDAPATLNLLVANVGRSITRALATVG